MDLAGHKVILASGSPRRRELLAGLDIDFTVDTGNTFEEFIDPSTPHRRIPEEMSIGKSRGFHRPLVPGEILITSDTLVLCGEEVLGKPHSRDEAIAMLRLLSGRSHEVITAVSFRALNPDGSESFETRSDVAKVHFKPLTDSEIEYYVDNFKPFDKAGAYAIQEWIGYVAIDRIEGSFYTIMGFPTHLVAEMLSRFVG
ncbi:MAG: Maf family nucleotide pyrophosphatase [Bacteroidales bacterium]|nr:Maf family nucleotide pyrophosphatase [Bacteroidales bacterium]